jgi:prepilin-type N-terminal cleavage/methylation domain-containing protein/prepilin-type processing-associated H-X9-DG protein
LTFVRHSGSLIIQFNSVAKCTKNNKFARFERGGGSLKLKEIGDLFMVGEISGRANCKCSHDGQKGFTLVELLVVIAIIALLLSILMPSLQKAKQLAQQVVCASRQKQLSLALMTYTQDYDGYVMPYSTVYKKGATNQALLSYWVSPDGSRYGGGTWSQHPEWEYWYAMLYVNKGIDSRDVFFCPSIPPINNNMLKAKTGKNLEQSGMGWTLGMRDWAIKDGTEWTNNRAPKKLDKISRPSDFFLLADTVCVDRSGNRYASIGSKYGQMFVVYDYGRSISNGIAIGVHLRHSDKASAVFADGHTEFKPYQYWCDLQNPDNWQTKFSMDKPGYRVFDRVDTATIGEWVWRQGKYVHVP